MSSYVENMNMKNSDFKTADAVLWIVLLHLLAFYRNH